MGFLNNLLYCWWILTNTEISAGAMVLPGLVGMGPKIGSTGREDRSDGRSSIRAGRYPSRYWDAAVPLADSSGSAAAMDIPSSPSISAGSVISGQMVRHVHV